MSEGDAGSGYREKAGKAFAYYRRNGIFGSLRNFLDWFTDKPDRITALSTFAIFLATVVTVCVGYLQWQALTSTDRATHKAAEAAMSSTNLLNQSILLEQRATLKIVNWNIDEASITKNRIPVIGFDFVNTGHTAAYMVSGKYDFTIAPDLPDSFQIHDRTLEGFPGIIAQAEKASLRITGLPAIDANEIADIGSGKQFVYLRVTALFRDFTGTRYEIITTGQYGFQTGFRFPERPVENEAALKTNCKFVAERKFNTYRRFEQCVD
jgi:hypothetical protein